MKTAFRVLAIVSMMVLPLVAQAETSSSGKSKETSQEKVQAPVVPPAPPVSGQMMPPDQMMGGMPMGQPGMAPGMAGMPGQPGIPGQPMAGGTVPICGPCCQEMMGDKMALKQMQDTITRLEVQISKMQEVIEKKAPSKK